MAVVSVACVYLSLLVSLTNAQFQLSFGTPTPPKPTTPRPTLPGGFDPACRDKINNCKNYGADSCTGIYKEWAQNNCESTCGFCKSLPTQPPQCVDKRSDCQDFDDSACTDPSYRSWAEDNCRRHCRLCTASQLMALDAMTTRATTLPPNLCVDKVDCTRYGQDACSVDKYGKWGQENCARYCGICQGVATPPPLCVDKNPDCARYQSDLCTNPGFSSFAEENCRKFCNKCGKLVSV
ncbi:putative tyrosinase-like protein tyr-3 [Aplysia californica]|uniref:Tyrosinase-like protein tyr-3 n=1 Tax=Aplysia californica TaxID=6500 RepID=A0ABM1A4S7_APLCA|nr:putative tyrosinase-like protein tyr-3 [Aplysia californica]